MTWELFLRHLRWRCACSILTSIRMSLTLAIVLPFQGVAHVVSQHVERSQCVLIVARIGLYPAPGLDSEMFVDRLVQQRCNGGPVVTPRYRLVSLANLAAG